MKTKNFFFASALLLSVVSTCGLTSCQDDETDDLNHQPDIHQTVNKSKNMKTTVKVSDAVLKLCDIKVSYTYKGKTVEEVLDESKFTISGTDSLTLFNETNYYDCRLCTISKCFGNDHLDVVVTATPKTDALSTVEAMQEDQTVDFIIRSNTSGFEYYDGDACKSGQTRFACPKQILGRILKRGVINVESLSCK